MSEADEEAPKRQFRGVWISAAIWESTALTWMEKCILAEVDSLHDEKRGGCYASNKHISAMFGSTESSIATMISRLRKLGWIETVSFDGRCRVIRLAEALRSEPPERLNRVKQALNPAINSLPDQTKQLSTPVEGSPKRTLKSLYKIDTRLEQDRAGAQEIWDALHGFFGHTQAEFTRLSRDQQQTMADADCTREELAALVRFYALPVESKWREAKTRKMTMRNLIENLREQVALAMKCCGSKKAKSVVPPASGNGIVAPEPTDEDRAAMKAKLGDLRKDLATAPEPISTMPIGRHARHAKLPEHMRRRFVRPKPNIDAPAAPEHSKTTIDK